ncbi:hypothetical protein [Marinomonas transparens]|uniref:Uncharacterized protein n=1 Tax=Marinomonas transparens TaxID=2795388 RepID=A0A934JJD6_9GAMM|nr:hypothetical protein [Marinomonas transparens]MBJ7537180.1 hypothetical protein [Marinomonas transparens]
MSNKSMSSHHVGNRNLGNSQGSQPLAKPRARMNRQNVHMLKSQLRVSQTLNILVRMGLTILEVHLGETTPLIIIQGSEKAKKLHALVLKRRLHNGVLSSYYSTQLNQCSIQWESKYVH